MKLLIALDNGTTQQVEAELVTINGIECFIYEDHSFDFPDFTISERKTGMAICFDFSREAIIQKAKQLLTEHNEIEWQKYARGVLQFRGMKYPVNN